MALQGSHGPQGVGTARRPQGDSPSFTSVPVCTVALLRLGDSCYFRSSSDRLGDVCTGDAAPGCRVRSWPGLASTRVSSTGWGRALSPPGSLLTVWLSHLPRLHEPDVDCCYWTHCVRLTGD